MSQSYSFEFAVGQDVVVKALATPGFVDAVTQDMNGTWYAVVFWLNGKRARGVFCGHELAALYGRGM